ncbi:MAG TPA: glycoside hydrolase family 3 N-terminal domain-containing protein [Bellilinea sp.]|nr:glycoside hydrolase family 3 N-terminal domain-containing protein [Bellilinea sp.]
MAGQNNLPRLRQIKKQVHKLLAQMTLEEKLAQLQAYWAYELQTSGALDADKIRTKLALGIGQITRNAGASYGTPLEAARSANVLQRFLKDQTRLGIPAIVHEECCAGAMTFGASVFPQPIGLASTWQPELARNMTAVISRQLRAIGAQQGLAPVLDIGRDPRWGRIEETFGEDPTLVSQFGIEYIHGLQGDDLATGVMATGKHFVAHSFSQGGLNCGPVHLGWRDLWDVYLAPFQAAIRDAGLASMMNAYPELDGEVVAASKTILTTLLREKLGFDGLVVSDYDAVVMIHNYHRAAETTRAAGVRALTAGIDVELPTVVCYGDDLKEAVTSGEISLEIVDQAVSRHLQKKFELGLFENPYINEGEVAAVFETKENRALAYQLACKSMVLLKNDGLLPLTPEIKRLAVIGPNADSTRCLLGDYSFTATAELLSYAPPPGSAFAGISREKMQDPGVTMPTVLEGIRQAAAATTIQFVKGCEVNSSDESGFDAAVQAASQADAVILVLGNVSGLAPECTTGEFRDTTDLRLPGVQEKLALKVLETGKPVALVLVSGRPVDLTALADPCAAILQAWVPGEEGGQAAADILFGKINPSGKLPLSLPRSAGQVPVFYNHKPSGMRSNIFGDYANEPVTPLYWFGHGLSYTTFKYSQLAVNRLEVGASGTVDISLTIENEGKVSGDEVVQLYIRDEYASLPRPVKELKGFARISLKPGETRQVTFHLPVDQLAYYDEDLQLMVEPGKFLVMVGSASNDIRLQGEFRVTGTENLPVKDRVFVCPVEVR